MRGIKALSVAVAAAMWLLSVPGTARAVPAFARKYATSCARCHTAFPKLNAYGESFKLRGYQTPGEEGLGVLDTRDGALNLLREFPLSARLNSVALFEENGKWDFRTPTGLSLFSTGTLTKDIGFLADFGPDEFEKWNLVFANLTRSHREPSALNFQAGQFEIMDFVFSQHRALTLTPYAIYQTNVGNWDLGGQDRGLMMFGTLGARLGAAAVSAAPAVVEEAVAEEVTAEELEALDAEFEQAEAQAPETPEAKAAAVILELLVKKGVITEEEATEVQAEVQTEVQPAAPPTAAAVAEAPAIPLAYTPYDTREGFFYQVALLNGNGTELLEHEGGHAHGVGARFDNNADKDFFGRLGYSHNNNRIGGFYYSGDNALVHGHSHAEAAAENGDEERFSNRFHRVGVDFSVEGGDVLSIMGAPNRRWNLFGLFLWGNDDNPLAEHDPIGVSHHGGFVEMDYLLDDRNVVAVRYDRVDLRSVAFPPDIDEEEREEALEHLEEMDRETLTLHYGHYLRRNIRVGVEAALQMRNRKVVGDQVGVFAEAAF